MATIQPKAAGAVDAKTGLMAHTEVIEVGSVNEAISYVPDPAPVAFPIVKREYKQQPNGARFDLTLTYEGVPDPTQFAEPAGETFKLERVTQLTPLIEHEDITRLITLYKGDKSKFNETGKVFFPFEITDENGVKQANPLGGVDAYYTPKTVWTYEFIVSTLPAWMGRELGYISEPKTGSLGQRPPNYGGSRNWILIGAPAEWRGNIWKCTANWLLSGPGGWVVDVYGQPSVP